MGHDHLGECPGDGKLREADQRLLWPQTELVLHLKKRSAFINITLEDITRITDRSDTLYSIDDDPQAVPPPPDRTLVGR